MANALTTLGTRLSARYGGNRLVRWQPNRNPTPPPRPYAEMGVAGTAVFGGYVQIKERSPEWIGRQKWITASELAINTSIVGAGVHYFLNLVAYPHWQFKPSDEDDEEACALAEFCDDVLNNMGTPWYKVVRRAAMYRFNGFGIQEWTAKLRDDGLIGFKDVEARPPHTIEKWDVDNDGTVLGMWQRSPQTGEMLGIPRDKVLYLVEDTLSDSPEGLGMFRHLASPYNRLKQLQDLEIRAYERDLRGIPIARAPLTMINKAVAQGTLTSDQAQQMVADMEAMVKLQVKQSDTGLVLDSLPYFSDSDSGDQVSGLPQWNFELLSGAGVGYAEIMAAIDRIQREMARILGVEHLMMGDTGGNRALSEDKSRNLYLVGNSVLKHVSSQVKQDILTPLFKLNGFPMKKMPTPETEDITFKNADAIAGALGKIASAGAPLSPNDPVINDMRELMGISRVPTDQMAQGAMPPNPMLQQLPPELQAMMGGAKPGAIPNVRTGKPNGLDAGPGADAPPKPAAKSAGKQDAANLGKALPVAGKPRKEEEEEPAVTEQPTANVQPSLPGLGGVQLERPNVEERPAASSRSFSDVLNPGARQQPKPTAQPEVAAPQAPEATTGTTQFDVNGAKPGGTVEVNTALLVRLLERLTGGPVNTQQPTQGGSPMAQKDPTLDTPVKATSQAQDQRAALAGADPKVQGLPDQGAADGKNLVEAALGKPVVGQPQQGAAGAVEGKPAQGKEQALPGAPGEALQGQEAPVGGKAPGQPQAAPGKPPGAIAGKPGEPQPGQPAGEGAPELGKPGDEAAAEPGQPGLPPGAQPPPGTPGAPMPKPSPMEEITADRASEILSPYAASLANELEEAVEQVSESDELWDRLGEEKNVEPNLTPPEEQLGAQPFIPPEDKQLLEQDQKPPGGAQPFISPEEQQQTGLPQKQPDLSGTPQPVEQPSLKPKREKLEEEFPPRRKKAMKRERL